MIALEVWGLRDSKQRLLGSLAQAKLHFMPLILKEFHD